MIKFLDECFVIYRSVYEIGD